MQRHPRARLELRNYGANALLLAAAIAVAFALPALFNAFARHWWPAIVANAELLLLAQALLAAALAVVLVMIKNAWHNREFVDSAKLASLVHARHKSNWFSRWRERVLIRKVGAADSACVMTVTGYDTFSRADSPFRQVVKEAREVRVMLLNPMSDGARSRADSLSSERDYYGRMLEELHASLDFLKSLHRAGKKVVLRFYDQRPFWKLVIVGDHVWVQYCQDGFEVNAVPEYVFALHSNSPERGLYTPFSMLFEEKWGDMLALDFDFDTDELVQRDAGGRETGRALLPVSPHAAKKLAVARHSQCALTGYIPNQA